tara:strand:+ start:1730 stop:2119 length:390 start_codon:yes stop_codon:yes gene_type:complete
MNLKILILNENNLNPRIIKGDIIFDKVIFPWDTEYFEKQNYSLKQLIFIYECLISFEEIEIIKSSTDKLIDELSKENKIFLVNQNKINNESNENIKIINTKSSINKKFMSFFPFWKELKPIIKKKFLFE